MAQKNNEPLEKVIQAAVLTYLQYHARVAWVHRMNTGAARYVTKGRERFIQFGFPGCSDILGQMTDGRFLAVEVKRPSGVVTDAQARFLSRVNDNGGLGFIARSVDDVERALK